MPASTARHAAEGGYFRWVFASGLVTGGLLCAVGGKVLAAALPSLVAQ